MAQDKQKVEEAPTPGSRAAVRREVLAELKDLGLDDDLSEEIWNGTRRRRDALEEGRRYTGY